MDRNAYVPRQWRADQQLPWQADRLASDPEFWEGSRPRPVVWEGEAVELPAEPAPAAVPAWVMVTLGGLVFGELGLLLLVLFGGPR